MPWSDELAESAGNAKQLVNGMVMYRGARSGSPTSLTGPSYFSSHEVFAKTYGKTAPFRLKLRSPLVVSDSEWHQYASLGNVTTVADAAARVAAQGHDSVINVRKLPGQDPLITVFLVDPKLARPARAEGLAEETAAIKWVRSKEKVKGGEYEEVEVTKYTSKDGRFVILPRGSMKTVRDHGAHGQRSRRWVWTGYTLTDNAKLPSYVARTFSKNSVRDAKRQAGLRAKHHPV